MIKNILRTFQGDLLEFDMILTEVPDVAPKIEKPRQLYEGETAFFETAADTKGNKIKITQSDLHFVIRSVNLTPGQYPFRAGVNLEGGEVQTVFSPQDSVLVVRRAEHA